MEKVKFVRAGRKRISSDIRKEVIGGEITRKGGGP